MKLMIGPVTSRGAKKMGEDRRRAKGKEYVSPRVYLSPNLNDLIGRKYTEYRGRGTMQFLGAHEGDVLVLFFPDEEGGC